MSVVAIAIDLHRMLVLFFKPLYHLFGFFDNFFSLHHDVVGINDSLSRKERPFFVLNESEFIVFAFVIAFKTLLCLPSSVDYDFVLLHQSSDLLLCFTHYVIFIRYQASVLSVVLEDLLNYPLVLRILSFELVLFFYFSLDEGLRMVYKIDVENIESIQIV